MVMMIMYSVAQMVVVATPVTAVATSASNQGDMTMLLAMPKLAVMLFSGM